MEHKYLYLYCVIEEMAFEGLDLGTDMLWFVECTDTPFGAHFLITLHIVALKD